MARIYADITALTGNTPLVRINRLTEGIDTNLLAKLEYYNPGNSVKDRLGTAIIDAAEKSGALKPGGTIVEGTSGNTGIALALVGAARGYNVILTMPETMSIERRVLVRAYGAEIVLTPGPEGMKGAVAKAEEIVANTPGAILARQFDNEANPAIHRATTAEEVWNDTDGKVDIFIAGVGTGGTITGVGQVLKERKPSVQIIGVEPENAATYTAAMKHGGPVLCGMKPSLADGLSVPTVGERAFGIAQKVVDSVVQVDEESIALSILRLLELEKGVVEGGGASSLAAILANKVPHLIGKTVVLILCGGNIDPAILGRVIEYGLVADGRLARFRTVISDRPGGLAKLAAVLAESGASVKQIIHDRAFASADVSTVEVECTVETRDLAHLNSVKEMLTQRGMECK